MRERTIYIDGNDIREQYGLVYSSFSEKVPEPKVTKVEIPAGSDLDITEAVGSVAYHNGTHEITFLLYGNTQAERVVQKQGVISAFNGPMIDYVLSWDGYSYHGRSKVEIENKFDNADVVKLIIDRYPWKTRRDTIDLNCTGIAEHELFGSKEYLDVDITVRQTASVFVGTLIHATYSSGTHRLSSRIDSDQPILVSVSDWWIYIDGANAVINERHMDLQDTDLALDSDFRRSGTNVLCTKEPLQHAIISYTRRDV